MRYKVLAPKYTLISGFLVNAAASAFFAFVLYKSVLAERFVPAVLFAILSVLHVFWFLFFLNKFIFAKVDTEKRVMTYGNLFFTQEVPIAQVKILGKYFSKIVRVQIGNKVFLINSTADRPEKVFER